RGDRRVAAGDADADVVVQDVDAAPQPVAGTHRSDHVGLVGDVGLAGFRRAALGPDLGDGLVGRLLVDVGDEYLRALAGVQQGNGFAVPHGPPLQLAAAEDQGHLVL